FPGKLVFHWASPCAVNCLAVDKERQDSVDTTLRPLPLLAIRNDCCSGGGLSFQLYPYASESHDAPRGTPEPPEFTNRLVGREGDHQAYTDDTRHLREDGS